MILFYFLAVVFAAAQANPTFFNQRQTGSNNYFANITDTNIIVIPSKELADAAINLALGKSSEPWRLWTNRLFRLAGIGKIPSEDHLTNTTQASEPQHSSTSEEPVTTAHPSEPQQPSTSETPVTTAHPIQKQKTTRKEDTEELTLIQTGIEECGPEGHRDSLGICNYDVPSSNPK